MSENDSPATNRQEPSQAPENVPAPSSQTVQDQGAQASSAGYAAQQAPGCAPHDGQYAQPAGSGPIPPQSGSPIPPQAGAYPGFAPEPQLTGGLKFGYFLLGFLGNLFGIVVAWVVNADKHPAIKSSAVKWSLVGFACTFVVGILVSIAFAGFVGAVVAAAAGGGQHYAYSSMCF